MSVPDRCSHGHRLTDKILYIDTRGYWRCRACRAFFMKESRLKVKRLVFTDQIPPIEPRIGA